MMIFMPSTAGFHQQGPEAWREGAIVTGGRQHCITGNVEKSAGIAALTGVLSIVPRLWSLPTREPLNFDCSSW